MNAYARSRALKELRFFAMGGAMGTTFVLLTLFLVPGFVTGMLAFIWVATRIEYAMVSGVVIDLVLHPKDPGLPRYMPATGFAAGLSLPIVLVTVQYLL